MQSKITLKNLRLFAKLSFTMLFLVNVFGATLNAQTTVTATQTPTTVSSQMTFNFTNTTAVPVVITDIAAGLNSAAGTSTNVSGYYKTSAINGAPGVITTANGWNQFGSATVSAAGTNANQPFFTCSLTVPAGATYGITLNAVLASDNTTTGRIIFGSAGTTTFTNGGCTITTGPNVTYVGFPVPQAPTGTPYYIIGAVTFVPGNPCAGTPAPGNTLSTVAASCTGVGFTLSAQNPAGPTVTGLTYQWQSSATGAAGSYVNIPGATNPTYTTTQTAATYYRLVVTCTSAGGGTANTTPIFIPLSTSCYCAAGSTNTSTVFEKIANVTFADVNQSSTSFVGYENYLTDTAHVIAGGTYPISITGNANVYAGDLVVVWIDFNNNGLFTDAGEQVLLSGPSVGPYTGNVTIPTGAVTGLTRMRVRMYDGTFGNGTNGPCGNNTYGQVEDYTVSIAPCTPIAITGQPANASVACGNNATFTVTTTGSLPAYQWEYRTSPTGPWLLVPNAPPYSGVNTATLTVAATAAQNGYQFRAVVSGACSGPDVSAPATLTVTPITLAVTPGSVTKCATDAPVLLSVPATQNTVSATNNTPVAVPDNVAGPTLSTVSITGVPAGANIANVSVTLNMSHTYPGDMIFNLKAPNGQILTLYQYNTLNGTGAASGVATWGWYGAKISSTGTVAFTTVATAPFIYNSTTNWKADPHGNAVALGFPFNDPAGYTSTATTWAQLASTTQSPNGTWTLAMADGGPGDVGTLSSWTLAVTYGGAPATAVFSPNAGLYTNAAGTTPYTGTAVTQVYANPTANATYTAVISAGACTGNPQTIQVNVNTPVGGTATLANQTICANTNASFALGGTLTGGPGFSHNYQVSTNNGVSYTNITNGGVYSGANTNTLVLTNVPYSYNGYKFRDSINTGGNCGSLISTVATLTVNPTPVVTISAAPIVNIYPGLTSTLTAAVSSATGPISYQWYLNGVAVPGATSNMYTVTVDHEGSYSVKVTDANGCTAARGTSTPGSITIGDSSGVTILFIYPSPNSGRFQVRYFNDINNGGTAPAFVNVYDSKGSRVFTHQYTLGAGYQSMNVDMGTHSRGLYRVELVDLNGNRIKTGSVMVF